MKILKIFKCTFQNSLHDYVCLFKHTENKNTVNKNGTTTTKKPTTAINNKQKRVKQRLRNSGVFQFNSSFVTHAHVYNITVHKSK
jgi:hypothetical protein